MRGFFIGKTRQIDRNNTPPYYLILSYGVVMNALKNMVLLKQAIALIKEKPNAISPLAGIQWMKKAMDLLAQFFPPPVKDKIDESSPDYQYLQSVIKNELPDMNSPEIGNRMTEILNRNLENSALISYIQQAVESYKEALVAISKQFLWGNN